MMEKTAWKIVDYFRRILHTILRCYLSLLYRGCRKRVPPIKNNILRLSATELARKIRERELTSEEVVGAFIDRIREVEPFINSVVESRFDEALVEAREADRLVASSASKEELERKKPLLGVPFSTKVLLTLKGLRCTAGSVTFKDARAHEDAVTVALMKNAGAIALLNTNASEVGMNFQTINVLHGKTCNPYDTTRTSGGSSGGESALIASAGSVIGLGTDLAGSIRLPCMFTGIFGHKPSRGLISSEGSFPKFPKGLTDNYLVTGPMCRYAQDLVTAMKILVTDAQKSAHFGKKIDFKEVTIHYLHSLGKVPLVDPVDPEIAEAVSKVVDHFHSHHGSNTKETQMILAEHYNFLLIYEIKKTVSSLPYTLTQGKEDLVPVYELLKYLCFQSKHTLLYILFTIAEKVPFIYNPKKREYYESILRRIEEYMDEVLDDRSVLVMPTVPFAAPYHHEILPLTGSSCYTHIFNVLGMPCTQCPVGFNRNGLPIGVQIVSKRGNDALTIACALEVEKAFGGWKPAPTTLADKYKVLKRRK